MMNRLRYADRTLLRAALFFLLLAFFLAGVSAASEMSIHRGHVEERLVEALYFLELINANPDGPTDPSQWRNFAERVVVPNDRHRAQLDIYPAMVWAVEARLYQAAAKIATPGCQALHDARRLINEPHLTDDPRVSPPASARRRINQAAYALGHFAIWDEGCAGGYCSDEPFHIIYEHTRMAWDAIDAALWHVNDALADPVEGCQ